MNRLPLYIIAVIVVSSCQQKKDEAIIAPFGEVTSEDSLAVSEVKHSSKFTLDDIQQAGEMILLTVSGPDTYYEYHGKGVGLQYLICERFAEQLGVSVRVEVCKDSTEVMARLKDGDGDLAVLPFKTDKKPFFKGTLADSISCWFKPTMVEEARKLEQYMFSHKAIHRRIFSPMLDKRAGVISSYDKYFVAYGAEIHWDWRLIAAQCYQESCFDPNAKSWAGACGLMQIMPGTAKEIGLALQDIYNPEKNIAAATRYLRMLESKFSDIRSSQERTKFVLASYNGGSHHIRDAMALAQKHGHNPHVWREVSPFVLGLMRPEMYNDPVVKYGYMRGSETADYVDKIMARYDGYRGVARPSGSSATGLMTPRKATKNHRFKNN